MKPAIIAFGNYITACARNRNPLLFGHNNVQGDRNDLVGTKFIAWTFKMGSEISTYQKRGARFPKIQKQIVAVFAIETCFQNNFVAPRGADKQFKIVGRIDADGLYFRIDKGFLYDSLSGEHMDTKNHRTENSNDYP